MVARTRCGDIALSGGAAPDFYRLLQSDDGVRGGCRRFYSRSLLRYFASASDFAILAWNSFIFSFGSALWSLLFGTLLAWLAERTNAPFRSVAYVSAFVSFAIPGIVKVIGWILLLGPKAGFINVGVESLTGIPAIFDIFSMEGMIVTEGFLWIPIVFLLMATPSVLSVLILTFIRTLEAFEIPALIGIPAGVEVFTTEIYLQLTEGYLPQYGNASAYSVLLIALVALAMVPYYRVTQHAHRFTTVTGKGFNPRRKDLGSLRWLGGTLLLVLPFLQVLPIGAMLWASLVPYLQVPSWEALSQLTLDNYVTAFSNDTIISSVLNSLTISFVSATSAIFLAFVTVWLVARTNIKWRWGLDQLAMLPLVFPGIVMGVAVLKMYLTIPLPRGCPIVSRN